MRETKIPKIFHQIWLGDHPMHPLMVDWRRRWVDLHPGWRFDFWREGHRPEGHRPEGSAPATLTCDHAEIESSRPELLARACHQAQRANIWRYEIVARFGGVYVDTDIEPIRPLDDLLGGLEAFAVRRAPPPRKPSPWEHAIPPRTFRSPWGHVLTLPALQPPRPAPPSSPPVYENAMFGAAPGHPWTKELLANLHTCDPAASLSMGVDYLTPATLRHPEVAVLPEGAVLFQAPADWAAAKREKKVPEAVYRGGGPELRAVHHWASLWYPSGFAPI